MTARVKQRVYHFLRIALCIAALAVVIYGVTFNDVVHLADGGQRTGLVVDAADPVRIRTPQGAELAIPRRDLNNRQGDFGIQYGLWTAWRNMDGRLFLLAVAVYFPIIFLQCWRFQWVVRAQGITLRYWESFRLSIAGNFLNFATPLGSNAGDVFKAYFLSLHTDRKTEAVTTVFLDRVIGLATLLGVVVIITLVSPSDGRLDTVRPWLLLALGVGIVGGFAYFSPPLRRALVPRRWLERLPAYEHLQRIDRSAHELLAHPAILAWAVFLTVVLQAIAVLSYFIVAKALGMRGGATAFPEYYTYFCTGVLVQSLPLTPQGLGTVELTYKYFLAPFGSPAQIVSVAFAIRLMVLLCALPGLLVTLTGSYRPATSPDGAAPPVTLLSSDSAPR